MVINLVAGFHALGTLMAIGIMILPAASARFWVASLDGIILISLLISIFGCYSGLMLSFYLDLPAGPAIVISLGIIYLASVAAGFKDGFLQHIFHNQHLKG